MKQRVIAGMGLAALMAVLVGCDEIKFGGMLTVHDVITFAQTGANKRGTVVVNPGQFQTKVILGMYGQEKQIKLEIDNAKPATVIDLNFDKNIETSDHFLLTAAQLKQNFDLAGDIVTTVTRTPEQTATESCTYQAQEMVCRAAEPVKSVDTDSQAMKDLTAAVDALNCLMQGDSFLRYAGLVQHFHSPALRVLGKLALPHRPVFRFLRF